MDTIENQRKSPDAATSPHRLLCDGLTRLRARQQEAIDGVKLAAYAADAMHVLGALGRHADISKGFDDLLKSICPDWRNPGSLDDPADLIAVALLHEVGNLQANLGDTERLLAQLEAAQVP